MFTEMRVTEFLDALSSKESVPGGGSGAALGGALGAALVSMVCNLTIGKKGYADVEARMRDLLAKSEALRQELLRLLEADTQVYTQVMAAYRLPRKTAEQEAAREAAMQRALKEAAEVPLAIAERCAEVVDLAMPAAEMGNAWAVSDAGVGVLLAEAAMRGALLNVTINLASITDADFVREAEARMATLTANKAEMKERVMAAVNDKIQG
ncbi:MAG TPA: cyclodeaminase/cyclohydrolase family protein [Chloroflexi bacterium]|jgi:formiminotetrahydrofolate cyclodeaminase|nr:cyclodeaminase/cyclohydrolase family protein [Chloroflexota bacterium]